MITMTSTMTTIELYEYFRRNVIRLQADAKNEKAENIQNEVAGLDEDKLEQYRSKQLEEYVISKKPMRDSNEISKEYEKRQKDIPLVPLYFYYVTFAHSRVSVCGEGCRKVYQLVKYLFE